MATLFEYFNTEETGISFNIYQNNWEGQTFTPTIAHKITSVKLKLWRYGLPGTITVSIRATDGAGKPTGGDLCSGTTNGNTLPTGAAPYEWREITLGAGYDLVASTKYAIVARCGGDYDIYFRWQLGWGGYAGGDRTFSSDSGSTWTLYASDLMFEEWGELPFPTQYSGLRIAKGGVAQELCLVAAGSGATGMGGIPRIRKGAATYDIYLVETADPNASPVRIKTTTGIKAIRKKT